MVKKIKEMSNERSEQASDNNAGKQSEQASDNNASEKVDTSSNHKIKPEEIDEINSMLEPHYNEIKNAGSTGKDAIRHLIGGHNAFTMNPEATIRHLAKLAELGNVTFDKGERMEIGAKDMPKEDMEKLEAFLKTKDPEELNKLTTRIIRQIRPDDKLEPSDGTFEEEYENQLWAHPETREKKKEEFEKEIHATRALKASSGLKSTKAVAVEEKPKIKTFNDALKYHTKNME